MSGITQYSAFIPEYRLDGGEVASAIGQNAKGGRAVAAFDQDTTTLGVEAALPLSPSARTMANSLWFATTAPVYADKANASTIHAALQLRDDVAANDLGATVRSGAAALIAAGKDLGLAVLADMRGGAVGGADERTGGDAAAAFLFGDTEVVAEVKATASATTEFVDRWRAPGETASRVWEERFGEARYLDLLAIVLDRLEGQGIDLAGITRFAVVSSNARAGRSGTGLVAARAGGQPHDLRALAPAGHAGTAQVGLALAHMLDVSDSDDVLLLVSLADGADALVLQATPALTDLRRPALRIPDEADQQPISYPQYLVWRNRIESEGPRRPEPERPSAPYAWRNREFKLALRGGRCPNCQAVQFPVPAVCYQCRNTGPFDAVDGAGRTAHIVTSTVDRLAFSPNPPLVSAVIQFEGGGRIQCELADVRRPPAIGDRVIPTFRRGATLNGIHNYVWKARPIAHETEEEPS